jgi:hypothetical protein
MYYRVHVSNQAWDHRDHAPQREAKRWGRVREPTLYLSLNPPLVPHRPLPRIVSQVRPPLRLLVRRHFPSSPRRHVAYSLSKQFLARNVLPLLPNRILPTRVKFQSWLAHKPTPARFCTSQKTVTPTTALLPLRSPAPSVCSHHNHPTPQARPEAHQNNRAPKGSRFWLFHAQPHPGRVQSTGVNALSLSHQTNGTHAIQASPPLSLPRPTARHPSLCCNCHYTVTKVHTCPSCL